MRTTAIAALIVLEIAGVADPAAASSIFGAEQTLHRYEWRASTFAPSAQHEAALDVAPDGSIVVVWSSRRQQDGRQGVYLQRFDADGVAIGGETAVGLSGPWHQASPAVAIDRSSRVWVVWQSHGQDGQAGGIYARQFDPSFVGGPELPVNQQWRGHQSQPVIAVSPEGLVLVVWSSTVSSDEPQRLCGRLFGPDGQPRTDEFLIRTDGNPQATASVASAPDGSLAVAYGVFDRAMKPAGIRMQRLSTSGARLGEEINVSGPPRTGQIEPVVAATPNGYVVAWLDTESDGDDYGVVARRLDREGRPLGEPFVVNTASAGPQNAAALAVAPDGRFVIAWNGPDEDKTGIFAQWFAADGARRGSEYRLNAHVRGTQALHPAAGTRRAALGPGGRLVVAWSGDAQLGDDSAVHVTMLTPRAVELAGRRQGVTMDMRPASPTLDIAGPHQPPTFDPRDIDTSGEREISRLANFGFTAILNTGWTPPDPHLAVGPNHIVVMTNGAIAFFTKAGTLQFQDEIEDSYGFWGSVGATGFVFDPEVLYDELSGRFFAMAAEAYAPPNQTKSYVLVAVSDDSDPNGTWYKYRFDTSALAGNLFDSPNIGVDADVVYITGDGFGITSNYAVYTFDKASLLAGLPPAVSRSTALATSTQSAGIPPVSFGNPPALYMIEHCEGSCSTVRLIALRDPLGSPYFTTRTLTVASYSGPEKPPQLGTSTRPETFDARFWSVAYRNGSLWATQHVNSSRVRARWYEIAMNGWPTSGTNPALVQSGEIDLGGTIRTFFSGISVNAANDAIITAARSSPSEYISMITAYRRHTDPLGTFNTPVIEKASSGPYSSDRWGDYAGAAADPANVYSFWAHHEYASGSSWRTWVSQLVLAPLPGDMNCDGLVNNQDIDHFVQALIDSAGYVADHDGDPYPACNIVNGDFSGDGLVNNQDIDGFVAALFGA